MNALPETLELVGVAEIAALAGTRKTAVINWRRTQPDFPKPVAELCAGPIFWKSQIEAWLDMRQANPKFQRYIIRQKTPGTRYGSRELVGPPKPLSISIKQKQEQESEEERLERLHAKIEREHSEMS